MKSALYVLTAIAAFIVIVPTALAGTNPAPARPATAAARPATDAGYRNWSQAQMKSVQRALVAEGYKLETSGTWDDRTHTAVKDFQQKHGLKPTGYPNKSTRKALGLDW